MTSVAVEYKKRLKEIFRKHNRSKVSGIDSLLSKYSGREHELYEKVCNKYGIDPEDEYYGVDDGDEEPEEESDDPFASSSEEEEKVVQKVVVKTRKPVAVAKPKPAAVAKPKPAEQRKPYSKRKPVAKPKVDMSRTKRAIAARNKQNAVQEDEKVESLEDEEDEVEEKKETQEEKKSQPVSYPAPNAWELLFRQTSTEKGGGPWVKHVDTENEEDPTNPMFANFKVLEGDYFRNRKGAFRFKLTWPSAPKKITPSEMTWLQTSHPFAEEMEGYEPETGIPEAFEGLWRPEGCASLCQGGECGLKIGLDEEHSDGVSQRGVMALDQEMAYVVEMYVAVPALARYPLDTDGRDLEGENHGELVGEAKFKIGALSINSDGYFKVTNCDMFKIHKLKKNFTVSVWVQQLKSQECAHIVNKGPWRKAFSIGIRHFKGTGNQTRFSVTGSQGQKVINQTTKSWDKFPQLADKELQKLALEEEDKTWYHFLMTLGDSTFTAYVNGELVGEQKFYGNAILRSGDLKVGAGGSGSQMEYPLHGRIFDFLLFDRALSPKHIKNLYECGLKKAADLDRREIQAAKDAAEALARKRAQPTDQYRKMMARMKMRKR